MKNPLDKSKEEDKDDYVQGPSGGPTQNKNIKVSFDFKVIYCSFGNRSEF